MGAALDHAIAVRDVDEHVLRAIADDVQIFEDEAAVLVEHPRPFVVRSAWLEIDKVR